MTDVALMKMPELDNLLAPIKPKVKDLIDGITFTRECGFALQQINANKMLLEADKTSIMQAVYNVALTGLSLNPVMKLAYLVPRKGKCVLDPSYQGLTKLIADTGSVKTIYSYPVYKGDHFEVQMGTSIEIKHIPKFLPNAEIEKFYAVAILPDNSVQFEVMTAEQVNEIRDKSEGYKAFKSGSAKSAIWNDHYPEMGRKTVIKRLTKYIPKTDRWERVAHAINVDDSDYKPTESQISFAETMIDSSAFGPDVKQEMLQQLHSTDLTLSEYEYIVSETRNNQLDRIQSGMNYNQTEIIKKVNTLL